MKLKEALHFMESARKQLPSISSRITHMYLRNVKKWIYCPACRHGKMRINQTKSAWVCEECGYLLSDNDLASGYVFWFCDKCDSYLNIQNSFNPNSNKHVCQVCGYENTISPANIEGICLDCGEILSDPNASYCETCKAVHTKRRRTVGGFLLLTGFILGSAALSTNSTSTDEDLNDSTEEPQDTANYPVCNICGTPMTGFDGWAWYTCPHCSNKVRIIDGVTTWQNEIFRPGKKEFYSDFDLADFCHGGDLTED